MVAGCTAESGLADLSHGRLGWPVTVMMRSQVRPAWSILRGEFSTSAGIGRYTVRLQQRPVVKHVYPAICARGQHARAGS